MKADIGSLCQTRWARRTAIHARRLNRVIKDAVTRLVARGDGSPFDLVRQRPRALRLFLGLDLRCTCHRLVRCEFCAVILSLDSIVGTPILAVETTVTPALASQSFEPVPDGRSRVPPFHQMLATGLTAGAQLPCSLLCGGRFAFPSSSYSFRPSSLLCAR